MSDGDNRELTKEWEPIKEGLAAARRHLGRRLREERGKAGLSQEQAAGIAGVSRPTYVKFELGTAIIGWKPLTNLAQHYGVKRSQLMPKEQYPLAGKGPVERRAFFRKRNENIRNMGKMADD